MPDPRESEARAAIVAACLRMEALGLNRGTAGNVSLRVGERFLLTPSGVEYDRLAPEAIVSMAFDGSHAGSAEPSSEWRLHREILLHRADAGAVVHTHSLYATALACLREGIPAFHYLVGTSGRATIPCAEYATYGTQELALNTVAALAGGRACLLANHGVVALGATLRSALSLAVGVETLATQYLLARQAGTPVLLDAGEMARVVSSLSGYGANRDNLATALREVQPADFDWLAGGGSERRHGLVLPPGGVDDPVVLRIVRGITERLHAENCRGAWLMVSGGEVVGLCSYRRPPAQGEVEIGYGVAPSRRGRGHASRAVAAMLEAAHADPAVRAVVAETAVANPASQRVLEHNGFERAGSRVDPEDGEVLTWRKLVGPDLGALRY